MHNPQLCNKAECETGQCGANCDKQHNGAVELEHVQKQSSNPWSSRSTDVHILACVHSTGPQGALSIFFDSSFTPLSPKIITGKCFFRSQHLTISPSMLFRKQPCSWGLLKNTPSTVWTGPVESLRTALQFPCSLPRALAQHGISQNQSFQATRDPNLARFWHAPPTQVGRTRISTPVDVKATIEALQIFLHFWSNSTADPRPQNSAGSGSTDVSKQLYRF